MTQKIPLPSNKPTLVCAECGNSAVPYTRYAQTSSGEIIEVPDDWPTYFLDSDGPPPKGGVRVEFCSNTCVVNWLKIGAQV